MAVDSLDECGVYFGTTGGQVYASTDAGDTWAPIVRDLPACCRWKCRPWHDPSRAAGAPARPPRQHREVQLDVAGHVTQRSVLDALERSYPVLRGTIRDPVSQPRRAYVRFFACEQDLSHESADAAAARSRRARRRAVLRRRRHAGQQMAVSRRRAGSGRSTAYFGRFYFTLLQKRAAPGVGGAGDRADQVARQSVLADVPRP